jgi:hypothetical protein
VGSSFSAKPGAQSTPTSYGALAVVVMLKQANVAENSWYIVLIAA